MMCPTSLEVSVAGPVELVLSLTVAQGGSSRGKEKEEERNHVVVELRVYLVSHDRVPSISARHGAHNTTNHSAVSHSRTIFRTGPTSRDTGRREGGGETWSSDKLRLEH